MLFGKEGLQISFLFLPAGAGLKTVGCLLSLITKLKKEVKRTILCWLLIYSVLASPVGRGRSERARYMRNTSPLHILIPENGYEGVTGHDKAYGKVRFFSLRPFGGQNSLKEFAPKNPIVLNLLTTSQNGPFKPYPMSQKIPLFASLDNLLSLLSHRW